MELAVWGQTAGHRGSDNLISGLPGTVLKYIIQNSNSNLYNPIWHRSQCCGVKWGARVLRIIQ